MGDRGCIVVDHDNDYFGPVVLYTHWGATNLPHYLQAALRKQARWNDPDYLTRIIVEELSAGANSDVTGVGIGTTVAGDAWRVIDVDVSAKTLTFREPDPDTHYEDRLGGLRCSFEAYIELEDPSDPREDAYEDTTVGRVRKR